MTILDEFRHDEQRVLDRLVDGELGLHERRQLLAAFDDEPGAWRRCALAYLEAQSWRWQLARAASEPVFVERGTSVDTNPTARRGSATFVGGALAVAAGLLVAFLLGTRVPSHGGSAAALADNPTNPQQTNAQADAEGAATQAPQIQSIATPAPPSVAQNHDSPPAESPEVSWELLTLTPLDGSDDPIQVRVAKDPKSSALAGMPQALWRKLSRSMEPEGWQVNHRQGLVPIDLSDGRRLEVPVQEINLRSPQGVQF